MAASRKMPTRERKAPTKTNGSKAARSKTARSKTTRSKALGSKATGLKARRAKVTRAAARAVLSRDIISLAEYRGTRPITPGAAVGEGLDRSVPLAKGHSAQVMLFTGVQIVRDIENA